MHEGEKILEQSSIPLIAIVAFAERQSSEIDADRMNCTLAYLLDRFLGAAGRSGAARRSLAQRPTLHTFRHAITVSFRFHSAYLRCRLVLVGRRAI